jgi:hypothetical protein
VILHPGILALLFGSGIAFLMMVYASFTGLQILTGWNFKSSGEEQLLLERKTFLISTIINYAFGFEILSLLLFIFTADKLHTQFVGAMCATGSLNANPTGWNVLYLKLLIFYVSALWITVNILDQGAEDYPLVRPKYSALLFITPLVGLDLFFQVRYFLGLHPEVITSCCGSLFSERGFTIAGDLASLPVVPMMWLFYGTVVADLGVAFLCRISRKGPPRYLLTLLSAALFFVAIASIVSFLSIYIYELPSHHCPFDMLQGHYSFIGYPIYLTLFGGVFFGLLPGLFHPLKKIHTLRKAIWKAEKKWLFLSILLTSAFVVLASWPVIFGNFTIRGIS